MDPPNLVCIGDWTTLTNLCAILTNAGCCIYKTFKNFKPAEIKQHIGLYMLQGLSPSPKIKYKFSSQVTDPVNENNLCHEAFGSGATRCHQEFKAFFAIQDPRKTVPNKKKSPELQSQSCFILDPNSINGGMGNR